MLRPLLAFFLTALLASAQETMIREVVDVKTDTHIEVLALFSKPSSDGYFPVRVTIANNLKVETYARLDFDARANYNNGTEARANFSFRAPANTTVTRDILVPISPVSGYSGSQVTITARLSGTMGSAENSLTASFGDDQPSVLLSEALYTPNASSLDSAMSGHSHSGRYGSSEFAGKFDPKQLPGDWLAFSGYDAVLMTDLDWTNVPPGARNAILSWVRLGGHLIIHTTAPGSPAALGLPADASFGRIDLISLPKPLTLDASQTIGRVNSAAPLPSRRTTLKGDFDSRWALQQTFGEKSFRYTLFIIVLVLFGILVGPVNLFVFAKSGRRHRLFITTPLISLGASFILIGLIIFQDGFGGTGQRVVLMEVRPDGDQNAAFIQQEQISRTGVLTRSNFTLDASALMTPVPISESRWARYTNQYDGAKGIFNLQPESGKMEASGDWFQSRSEHGHWLTAVVPTRGRIESAGSADRLVSTFDFPIKTIYYLDSNNKWHRASKIETGKPFTLSPVDISMVNPELAKLKDSFSARLAANFRTVKSRPGHYIAITEAAPGIATHPGIDWQKTQTIITGPVVNP